MRFILPISAFLLGLAGCTTCHHRACDLALEESRCPEAAACQRMNVYAIIVKGFDPLDVAGVETLAESLIQAGFPKVYRIESHHSAFIVREVARIRCEQPEARFVLVGSGTGSMLARHLAGTLSRAGASVDAVVEIGPVHSQFLGRSVELNESVRHIVIGRIGHRGYSPITTTEYRIVPGLGRWSTCSNPFVADMVKDEMILSAQNVSIIEDAPFASIPLLDHPAPLPGGVNIEVVDSR